MNEEHYFKMKMGLGIDTNNFLELNNLRLLLIFALQKGCRQLQIFGDSKLVINWFNLQSKRHMHTLKNLLDEVLAFKSHFDYISA